MHISRCSFYNNNYLLLNELEINTTLLHKGVPSEGCGGDPPLPPPLSYTS